MSLKFLSIKANFTKEEQGIPTDRLNWSTASHKRSRGVLRQTMSSKVFSSEWLQSIQHSSWTHHTCAVKVVQANKDLVRRTLKQSSYDQMRNAPHFEDYLRKCAKCCKSLLHRYKTLCLTPLIFKHSIAFTKGLPAVHIHYVCVFTLSCAVKGTSYACLCYEASCMHVKRKSHTPNFCPLPERPILILGYHYAGLTCNIKTGFGERQVITSAAPLVNFIRNWSLACYRDRLMMAMTWVSGCWRSEYEAHTIL